MATDIPLALRTKTRALGRGPKRATRKGPRFGGTRGCEGSVVRDGEQGRANWAGRLATRTLVNQTL